jgi:hypothetical protein
MAEGGADGCCFDLVDEMWITNGDILDRQGRLAAVVRKRSQRDETVFVCIAKQRRKKSLSRLTRALASGGWLTLSGPGGLLDCAPLPQAGRCSTGISASSRRARFTPPCGFGRALRCPDHLSCSAFAIVGVIAGGKDATRASNDAPAGGPPESPR